MLSRTSQYQLFDYILPWSRVCICELTYLSVIYPRLGFWVYFLVGENDTQGDGMFCS